jgi:hypothetical protein
MGPSGSGKLDPVEAEPEPAATPSDRTSTQYAYSPELVTFEKPSATIPDETTCTRRAIISRKILDG